MTSKIIRKKRSSAKLVYSDRHVLVLSKSNVNTSAQVQDPISRKTLFGATSATVTIKGTKSEKAAIVGQAIADMCKKNKISTLVVNRSGYRYHGRIKSLVESVRSNGITI